MKAMPLAETLCIQPHLIRPTESRGLHLSYVRVVSQPIPRYRKHERAMNARAFTPDPASGLFPPGS
jgi:hypothetical protein